MHNTGSVSAVSLNDLADLEMCTVYQEIEAGTFRSQSFRPDGARLAGVDDPDEQITLVDRDELARLTGNELAP